MGLQINLGIATFTAFAFINFGESIGMSFCSFIEQPGFNVQVTSAVISTIAVAQGLFRYFYMSFFYEFIFPRVLKHINSINMPAIINYLNYLSMAYYIARVNSIQAFTDITFTCSSTSNTTNTTNATNTTNTASTPCQFQTGEDVLGLLDFPQSVSAMRLNLVGVCICLLAYRLIVYLVMKYKL
jgi:hypothetical protein